MKVRTLETIQHVENRRILSDTPEIAEADWELMQRMALRDEESRSCNRILHDAIESYYKQSFGPVTWVGTPI